MDSGAESLENRICDFIVKQSRFSRKKLSSSTRLAQDIGMDGDDAVEFFEEFGKRFSVDLERLHVHWERHFAPEGGRLSLGAIVLMTCCGVCGFVLCRWLGVFPGWVWAALLAIAALWICGRWLALPDLRPPITVADLIEAARAGRWTMSYQREYFRFDLSS